MKKRIKVRYASRRTIRYSFFEPSDWTIVPKIQLEGKWLDRLGYKVGDLLLVECDNSGIHIRHEPPESMFD